MWAALALELLLFTPVAYEKPVIPAEYDRPYVGELIVEYVEPDQTAVKCGQNSIQIGLKGYYQACAYATPTSCRVILPKDTGTYPRAYLDYLYRHEVAHCNGWRH